ncbi:hypothetical protein NB607_22540 [Vibrio alginolyticus]|uniref:hypothetical protein n=2 Tax=Vibrio alginolyticus TaxID=663 RepID=UPI00215CED69|nr:hypothetical protein [Vibrio alginolyticus]MCS0039739.1 hypothetical protein [Vibrio alginolyticus]
MATIIRLKNVQFSNNALPVVTPFVRNGLVAAWRFANGPESLIDLSGNGRQLTEKGSVSYTELGILGDQDNGFLTDVNESNDVTLMAVWRATSEEEGAKAFAVGNFFNDTSPDRGLSIWYQRDNANNSMASKSQCHYYNTGTGLIGNEIVESKMTPIDQNFTFTALTVNTNENSQSLYVPKNNSKLVRSGPDKSYAQREISSMPFEICSTPDAWNNNGGIEVAEVIIYNKALSEAEVLEQYELSKQFHKSVRGIDV